MGALYIEAIIVVCSILIILIPFFLLVLVFTLPFCPKSNCDAFWKRLPYVVLKILAIPAFFGFIMMILLLYQMKGYFIEHFDEYKCKPWFMPFVSWVKPDVSATGNFMGCMSQSCRGVFASMTTPFVDLADELGTGMNLANMNFGHVQDKHMKLGNSMVNMMSQHTNTMGKYQAMSQYLFLKVKAIFDKMLATVFDVYYALITMLDLVNIAVLAPQYLIIGVFVYGAVFIGIYIVLFLVGIILIATGMSEMGFFPLFPAGIANRFAGFVTRLSSRLPLGVGLTALMFGSVLDVLSSLANADAKKRNKEIRIEKAQYQYVNKS